MVEFQENIICGRFFIKFPTKFLKNNMGKVKIEFQENNIRGRVFVQNLSSRKKLLTKSSANNMWQVKFEFQENNNGLRFCTQTVVPYGNIFL